MSLLGLFDCASDVRPNLIGYQRVVQERHQARGDIVVVFHQVDALGSFHEELVPKVAENLKFVAVIRQAAKLARRCSQEASLLPTGFPAFVARFS
jgi:hypothetical protein|tara:strand:- start:350 stop:634 length:285 start_codon:yes stop_codon:yes gene_type:complete